MNQETVMKSIRLLLASAFLLSLSACSEMGSGEYGVKFSALPRWAGGGVGSGLIGPGEKEVIMPWETVYRLDTTLQTIEWGDVGRGDNPEVGDLVETRAKDGNEVGLAITIQYHIDPPKVGYIVQNVGVTNEKIRKLVEVVARSDIRTHMNVLNTSDFFNPTKRKIAGNLVKGAINARLEREGIIIDDVIYKDHRFERRKEDGPPDTSYQDQIDQTQAKVQETEQNRKRLNVVEEDKRREFRIVEGTVSQKLEKAEGKKAEVVREADAYLLVKKNEAKQILTAGTAEVAGLKKRIEALSGPGGEALVRLELVRSLVESNPKFILMNSSADGAGSMDFNKVDTNELIRQAGLFAGVAEGVAAKAPPKISSPEMLRNLDKAKSPIPAANSKK